MNTYDKATSLNPEDWPIFSYSQLQVWDRCEYKWFLNYEEEWTLKEKKASLNIGSLAHKYLEIYYNAVKAGFSALDAWDMIEAEMAKHIQIAMDENNSNALTEIHRAGIIVKKYVFDFAPTADLGIKIVGVEHHFMVPYKTPSGLNFYLQGYVDLIYSKQGKLTAVDHKTTANAGFWKPWEILMDPQMTLYCSALRKIGIPIFDINYNFLNSYEYKDMKKVTTEKLFKREPSYRTDVELSNFEHQLLIQIEKLIVNTGDDEYKYNRSLRRDCDSCWFKEPCLHGLKGINPQAILITKFKKKDKMPAGIRPGSEMNSSNSMIHD